MQKQPSAVRSTNLGVEKKRTKKRLTSPGRQRFVGNQSWGGVGGEISYWGGIKDDYIITRYDLGLDNWADIYRIEMLWPSDKFFYLLPFYLQDLDKLCTTRFLLTRT